MSKKPAKKSGYSQKQRIIDYRSTFGTPHGRRVLFDLIGRGHVLGSVMQVGATQTDPYVVVFRDGERNIVNTIMEFIGMTPADIVEAAPSVREQFGLGDDVEHPLALGAG